ncbi:MAG: hypothetical protein K1000chlam4_01078 [Chlamydiae bacterium]|nr:hypothetical protein [Chlamydiota bacterium]
MKKKESIWRRDWSPYLVGSLIGLLVCFAIVTTHHILGGSSTFVNAAAAIESIFSPNAITQTPYYLEKIQEEALINWQAALLCFLFIGAMTANKLSAKSTVIWVPKIWKSAFGPSRLKRACFAFLGGLILVFGARIAGGCTSGHGISGGMQFAISSWAFFFSLFASGVCTAFLLYKRKG